ncbi:MAG: response regulator [Oscillospiraceae bacterium]|nr:response regulator [Oscillospiraceae bacterium]
MQKKIMVVDDSRFIFEDMKHKFEGIDDYSIEYYCPDGETALEKYSEYKPDLVTVDIVMPGIDGFETAKALLEKHPDAKIVMVSSLAFDETMEEAKELGTLGFIAKPFELQEVLICFNKIFNPQQ